MVEPGFLAHIPLFQGLSAAEREHLAGLMHERRYPRGTVIFHQGDPGEACWIVREGRIKVYRLTADGQEQILGLFLPGDPFGLVVALDRSPYPATAEAVEDSRVWMIRSDDLQKMATTHPGLLEGMMREVAERLRRAQERVHSLATRSVHGRLAEFLLRTAEAQAGRPVAGPVRIRLTMTHQELGGYLGASRETVTRALTDLRRKGAVSAGADGTLLVDPDRLRDYLDS